MTSTMGTLELRAMTSFNGFPGAACAPATPVNIRLVKINIAKPIMNCFKPILLAVQVE